jgi:CubicO group peptidase (beta-lactamase class C family)
MNASINLLYLAQNTLAVNCMSTSSFSRLATVCFVLLSLSSCQLGRFIYYNFADITDHKVFDSRSLEASPNTFYFPKAEKGRAPKTISETPFEEYLEDNKTVAFLIIQHDTIQYENYFRDYERESIVASFSMAKSVTSILVGCAIDDGFIQSVEEPVTNYIPELKENGFDEVKIKHLLQMTSGLDFKESYVNPFGDAASFYYGKKLKKQVSKMKLETKPGTRFEYVSGSTQILGLILDRALNDKTITQYLQEKIWTPIGMEYGGSWSLDQEEDGLEKTFCCLNARAIDFAKIGRLYKNEGRWGNEQIVPSSWVEESTKADTTEGSVDYYQYQWWLPTPGKDFMAIGILGQYVYVHPEKDLIIVRLGEDEGDANWWSIFTSMAEKY